MRGQRRAAGRYRGKKGHTGHSTVMMSQAAVLGGRAWERDPRATGGLFGGLNGAPAGVQRTKIAHLLSACLVLLCLGLRCPSVYPPAPGIMQ